MCALAAGIRALPPSPNRDALLEMVSLADAHAQAAERGSDGVAEPGLVVCALDAPCSGEIDLLLRALSTPGLALDGLSLCRATTLDLELFTRALVGGFVPLRKLRSAAVLSCQSCEHLPMLHWLYCVCVSLSLSLVCLSLCLVVPACCQLGLDPRTCHIYCRRWRA